MRGKCSLLITGVKLGHSEVRGELCSGYAGLCHSQCPIPFGRAAFEPPPLHSPDQHLHLQKAESSAPPSSPQRAGGGCRSPAMSPCPRLATSAAAQPGEETSLLHKPFLHGKAGGNCQQPLSWAKVSAAPRRALALPSKGAVTASDIFLTLRIITQTSVGTSVTRRPRCHVITRCSGLPPHVLQQDWQNFASSQHTTPGVGGAGRCRD